MKQARKTVLIVDDERTLLYTFSNSLTAYSSELNVLTAENGRQAVETLGSKSIDLIVTDLRMPEMDGFELLIHLKKHYPGIPVIVMTAVGSPEVAERLKNLGAVSYLEKPINIKDLALRIFQGISWASEGKICGVTLAGFLQLIVMEKKSCALKIGSGDRTGVLLIKDGELIDAKTRDLTGDAAACEIVTWEDTEIKMGNYTGERRKNIDTKLSEILLDAFRMKDERERAARRAELPDDVAGIVDGRAANETAPGAGESAPAPDTAAGGSVSAPESAVAAAKTPAAEPAGAGRGGDLKELLSTLSKLQGVTAACLAGTDGFLIDGIFNSKMEAELVGAIASSGFGASEAIGLELGRGALELTMLEFAHGAVLIAPVGKKFVLIIMTDRHANLGMLRVKVRKLGKDFEAAADAV